MQREKINMVICLWMEKTYTAKTPHRVILRSPLSRIHYYHNKRLQTNHYDELQTNHCEKWANLSDLGLIWYHLISQECIDPLWWINQLIS